MVKQLHPVADFLPPYLTLQNWLLYTQYNSGTILEYTFLYSITLNKTLNDILSKVFVSTRSNTIGLHPLSV